MNSLKISAASFEPTVNSSETLILRFVLNDDDAIPDQALRSMFPNAVFAHVRVDQEPTLATMFSVNAEPAIAIFRQRIVLFVEKGEQDSETLAYLLQKISMLDMDKVRQNIQQEKAAQALHMRRVCPTVRARMI